MKFHRIVRFAMLFLLPGFSQDSVYIVMPAIFFAKINVASCFCAQLMLALMNEESYLCNIAILASLV
jgi:hypothetical protein